MKIKNWKFKNYKSFGGIEYSIDLNQNKGELILLSGQNGDGKSSSLTALDVALYGTELNKRGTKLAKANYPNRVNGNMTVSCEVETPNGDILNITRSMQNTSSPIKTKLKLNGVDHTPVKLDDYITKELGMDFSTFKSFCSINVSYFKNFMSLTPEDKRMILDKMFNMQQINDLNKILKTLNQETVKAESSLNGKIETYKRTIKDLESSIEEYLEQQQNNDKDKLESLELEVENLNKKIEKLESLRPEIEEGIAEFNEVISKLQLKEQNYKRDIRDVNEKISLYRLGKCPTCHHELKEELNLLPGLEEQVEKTNQLIAKVKDKIKLANEELSVFRDDLRTLDTKVRDVNSKLNSVKTEIRLLSNTKTIDVDLFKQNIKKQEDNLKETESEYIEVKKMQYVYNVLLPIWTDNGIKKQIIDSIIDPINAFIKEDLERIKTPFRVELDDKFDAHVYEFMNEVDVDSLSSGETRRINLIIMLAYIKMMRMQSNMNLLILDEVFTTIDLNGIDEILYLLKDFAEERLISIIVVHHTELKEYFFDKLLKVEKPYFSILETIIKD